MLSAITLKAWGRGRQGAGRRQAGGGAVLRQWEAAGGSSRWLQRHSNTLSHAAPATSASPQRRRLPDPQHAPTCARSAVLPPVGATACFCHGGSRARYQAGGRGRPQRRATPTRLARRSHGHSAAQPSQAQHIRHRASHLPRQGVQRGAVLQAHGGLHARRARARHRGAVRRPFARQLGALSWRQVGIHVLRNGRQHGVQRGLAVGGGWCARRRRGAGEREGVGAGRAANQHAAGRTAAAGRSAAQHATRTPRSKPRPQPAVQPGHTRAHCSRSPAGRRGGAAPAPPSWRSAAAGGGGVNGGQSVVQALLRHIGTQGGPRPRGGATASRPRMHACVPPQLQTPPAAAPGPGSAPR